MKLHTIAINKGSLKALKNMRKPQIYIQIRKDRHIFIPNSPLRYLMGKKKVGINFSRQNVSLSKF